MKHLRATLAVGLLAVAGILLVMFGVWRSNRGIGTGSDTYRLVAMFDDITGITGGTKVTIAGYTVGQVDEIKLIGTRVRVVIRIKRTVVAYAGLRDPATNELRNAAALTRVQASFLGDFYLELAPGAAGRVLKEGDTIPRVITATGLQATLAKMEDITAIVPKIDKIVTDVSKITNNAAQVFGGEKGAARFDELAANLVKSSENLSETTHELRERLVHGALAPGGDLDKGLHGFADTMVKVNTILDRTDALVAHDGGMITRTLENAESVTRSIRDLLGRNQEGVDTAVGTVSATLKKLQDTLTHVDGVISNLQAATKDAAEGKGTVGRLLHDDKLIKGAERMMDDAGGLLARYARLETSIDYRFAVYSQQRHDPSSLSWQSHMSLRLSPTPDKFVQATITSDNLGKVTKLTRVTTTQVGKSGAPPVSEQFTETTSDWKIGIVYGRRFSFLTLRGGLIESTAGAGVDVHLFNDRITVSGDIFRFTDAPMPRLRLLLLWEFWHHVYAWAGGDELLYPSTRADIFGGIGLSFTDNDLRILFAAAPSISTR